MDSILPYIASSLNLSSDELQSVFPLTISSQEPSIGSHMTKQKTDVPNQQPHASLSKNWLVIYITYFFNIKYIALHSEFS